MEELYFLEDLKYSVEYMESDDWKKRFIAEYAQLVTRIEKLLEILWEENENDSNCPLSLLSLQVDKMSEYRQILEIRAELYGIDLDAEIERLNKIK